MSHCGAHYCYKPVHARGLCSLHYRRQLRGAETLWARRDCQAPDCFADLTDRRPNVRYCDRHCQNAAARHRAGLPPLGPRRNKAEDSPDWKIRKQARERFLTEVRDALAVARSGVGQP